MSVDIENPLRAPFLHRRVFSSCSDTEAIGTSQFPQHYTRHQQQQQNYKPHPSRHSEHLNSRTFSHSHGNSKHSTRHQERPALPKSKTQKQEPMKVKAQMPQTFSELALLAVLTVSSICLLTSIFTVSYVLTTADKISNFSRLLPSAIKSIAFGLLVRVETLGGFQSSSLLNRQQAGSGADDYWRSFQGD